MLDSPGSRVKTESDFVDKAGKPVRKNGHLWGKHLGNVYKMWSLNVEAIRKEIAKDNSQVLIWLLEWLVMSQLRKKNTENESGKLRPIKL